MNLPADIMNQALDAVGVDFVIGDPEEGTHAAQVCLRAYGQCLRQLLRGANWDFARKTVPLVLLADATGNTPYVGTVVPVPWVYEYSYPTDCMKARFVPQNWAATPDVPAGNIQFPSNVPLTSATTNTTLVGARLRPARFLVATDYNYPPQAGQITWETQGVSPTGSTVILTNVKQASLIYTALMLYPSTWDPLFREAMVALLGSKIALPLAKDKKFGLMMRNEQTKVAKETIIQARIADGNEGFYSSDIPVDWLNVRQSGGTWGNGAWGGNDAGCFGYGNDAIGFADGTAF